VVDVPRRKKSKVVVELNVALGEAGPHGELERRRASVVQSTRKAVIEDVIMELEWESPARWGPVLERLRDVARREQAG
jgi:hypothetical protein